MTINDHKQESEIGEDTETRSKGILRMIQRQQSKFFRSKNNHYYETNKTQQSVLFEF